MPPSLWCITGIAGSGYRHQELLTILSLPNRWRTHRMRRRVVLAVIGAPLALIGLGAGAILAVPRTRHLIAARLNMPDRMSALSANSQVHYEPGAEDFADDVAALLPDAITRSRPCMAAPSSIRLSLASMRHLKPMRPQTG